jgi:hypothetical protein
MYYPDLTCYRINSIEGVSIVYPGLKNIGWLDKENDYMIGEVSEHLIQKLKEILFLDLKNAEDKANGTFNENEAIIVHNNFMRSSAYDCQFCKITKKIFVDPSKLQFYRGKGEKMLGRNEIILPSLKRQEFYVLPTMIYHYITVHNYKPPAEFLNALEFFDLSKPFNIEKDCVGEMPIKMKESEVNSFVPENGFSNYEKYIDEYSDEDYEEDCNEES